MKKLEKEMIDLLDAMTERPPEDWILYTNGKIKVMKESGFWDTLECWYNFSHMPNDEDALINWINPKQKLKL